MFKKNKDRLYLKFLKKKEKFKKMKKAGKVFKDSDRDGLSDYEEKHIYKTNPHKKDTDGDGMPDGLEVKLHRNPLGKGSFRNLFIPNKHNNYCPDILKPRRLLFYAMSLIAVKFIMVVFIISYPLSAFMSVDVSMEEIQKIISLTNNLRAKIDLLPLKENQRLDMAATQKVQDMFAGQYFAHMSPSGVSLDSWINKSNYKYSVAGENLAIGYTDSNELINAWKNSPTHYDNIIDPNFQEVGVAISSGIFDNIDTVLAAQYFARPEKIVALPIIEKTISEIDVKGNITIKGDDLADSKIIKAEVELPKETVSATAVISNEVIELGKVEGTDNWSGTRLISSDKEKEILTPLIPATLVTSDNNGKITNSNLDWKEITPIKTSVLDRYNLYKNSPKPDMIPTLFFGGLFFKVLLGVFLAAFVSIFFIKIKKRKLYPILSSLGIIGVLIILIIF